MIGREKEAVYATAPYIIVFSANIFKKIFDSVKNQFTLEMLLYSSYILLYFIYCPNNYLCMIYVKQFMNTKHTIKMSIVRKAEQQMLILANKPANQCLLHHLMKQLCPYPVLIWKFYNSSAFPIMVILFILYVTEKAGCRCFS